jgi:tetratricopeptide (TPR) repeat protein
LRSGTVIFLLLVVSLIPFAMDVIGDSKMLAQEPPQVEAAARKARDRVDVAALRSAIEAARQEATRSGSFDAYERLALFSHWMVEIAHASNDKILGRNSASEGIEAAQKAIALSPNSAEAHALLGNLYGDIIPFTFMGGPRYGPKSTKEAERSLELDPNNVEGHIGLAIDKIFTPPTFGGDVSKAIELLQDAIKIDPGSDTAHAWLAHAYEAHHQHDLAVQEINRALELNPDRRWLQYVQQQISNGKK